MVAFPAAFLFIGEPVKEEAASGAPSEPSTAPGDRPPDLEVRDALGARRFWLIAFALMLVSTVTQGTPCPC